ncbi:MAG: hypothetical protein LQ343_007425 [Gyalolechia ehrenbergii]|nr:MAG: hypothetical protein LQ343_007425 [Gyalolechia ehrenbergii]
MINELINILYNSDYDDGGHSDDEDDKRSESEKLAFNVGMYIVGDRFNVSDLKELAREKFATAVINSWSGDDLPHIIRTIYDNTMSTNLELHSCLTSTLQKHNKALRDNEYFMEVVKTRGEFAMDLIDAWGNFGKEPLLELNNRKQVGFGLQYNKTLGHDGVVSCPHCNRGMTYSLT